MKTRKYFRSVFMAAAVVAVGLLAWAPAYALTGAIYTTESLCDGVNLNIYANKDQVYVNGGPAGGGSGLPDGYYYVKVTEPDGTPLGASSGAPVHVTSGAFDQCYQLSAIVYKNSDNTLGYDTTGNGGGVYKVWVSSDSAFSNDNSKTDNFKVKCDDPCTGGEPPQATLGVIKFYDANANGIKDGSEVDITGWKIRIVDSADYTRFTPVSITVDPDTYTVTEADPVQTNWIHTSLNSITLTLADGDDNTVEFGNVCVGAGGGLTLGFWSNKNGQALFGADDLALMVSLNLRNADGTAFNPASYSAFRTWLLNATATNMAYMLSAQLAAMELNVLNGKVGGGALVYAPGVSCLLLQSPVSTTLGSSASLI